ncbi:hypothetical protein EGW08_017613 [Elysia chlorotica]|uniref:Uncharacterized protein n=1 Tax=Elysia chlorotica TaxID=188477 RepID=A0A3S0ZAQ5_ELYCH|nr:hypothetical protein EGW08_017613 [Elysia chlorotica]
MYVDVDEGTLGFGNEVTFWGNVITNLPRGKPLFPMIGTNKYEANVQLIYRGSAGTSGFDMFTGGASGFDPNSTPASSYTLPPLTGPLPPKYSEVYHIPLGETGTDNPPDFKPREAWEMTPPPPSAPADSPPPYTSPTPQY